MESLARLWKWLVSGSSEMYLPKTWLANKERIAEYERWTQRELASAFVSKDTAAMARDAFWVRNADRQVTKDRKVYSIAGRR